jgi:hypothetical protein
LVLVFALIFVVASAVIVALMRLGLLVAVAAIFAGLLQGVSTSFTAWYGQGSFLIVLVLSALALWAFRTSLGGRKLLG